MKSSRGKMLGSSRKAINRIRGANTSYKDPVQVYCRLKPMQFPNDVSCMRVVSDSTIVITPPESAVNFRNTTNKEIQTTFTHVFPPDATQKEIFDMVALPLVENLIQGRNGLLFTYGVTGSGKTYTMTGDTSQDGIMPRCFDVIFNSIINYQTKKFVFKPDKLNGFDVQSEADAMLDRQSEIHAGLMSQKSSKSGKLRKAESDSDSNPALIRGYNEIQVLPIEQDNAYAVFVTYVEIYNNSVYDLLDDDDVRNKTLQSKIVREDGNKNMYVHAVTEVEVKSSEEAFEVFHRGQRKRRVAHTALNAESSRSHSTFTIRLVQAPLDSDGEQVTQDKRVVWISQLSLVDLAGSERTNRTKNTGQRLREAGNINNSLMTLRSCMEILRENQIQGTNKMVPYRDSKLTHLFKNYFDGEGQVRMIVCVNPRADDYDETIQVMKFAEVTQEVQVARPTVNKIDLGYTPGRRQANKIFKEAKNRLEKEGRVEANGLEIDIGLVYSLGGPFPELEMNNPQNDQIITNLMHFLEQRINKRNMLRTDLQQKQNEFRKMISSMEKENISLKVDNASLKATNAQQKKKIVALEGHLGKTEAQIDSLICKLNSANETIKSMQQEVKNRDMVLNQRLIDKQRAKQKYNTKIQVETDKMNKELEVKLRQQREQLQNQMKAQDDKLRLVKQILVDENVNSENIVSKDVPPATPVRVADITKRLVPFTEGRSRKDKTMVSNVRYRRSQSADRWIDHRPGALAPLGTVLQPIMRRRRSVTRLTSPKEITDGASRYCLVAQEHDTDGELETKLFKGDILPTSGGGAQVVFNDMECLKQSSPKARKRSGLDEVDSQISLTNHSLELHNKRPRIIN
ncbi:kinesin-like protein KIF23 isoform X1 [Polistes fuscatus]|uniref:kinesin-like protein KIF23 isoform X1 n=2 Tax=Polistes fuscatus TaxID=30207 RepID=UPI001CA7D441|nr:kinesin-like protein KIF23 isoform X1 [Polistes fuscatus]XP_043505582.1 kinesin-like protein KIF23 isoform X1 [Polistes fuscatus]XP_043505583.1 kinesin-like protein KIF23 isoform X1 [Polistes fuscatus]